MISEQLRATLLSLKLISDRLKLLNTTSVTKSEALAYKNEIIAAIDDIDFTEITEALDSIDDKIDDISTELEDVAQEATLTQGVQDIREDISNIDIDTSDLAKQGTNPNTSLTAVDNKIGTAPVGSDNATIFAWLTTIYEYLAGQTPEEIPEGLGDRINLLLQFFGLPQALPEYQSMTEEEIKSINTDVWVGLYGYEVVKNTLHYKNFIDEVVTIDTYFNSGKSYADYGYASLWSAHDVTVDVNSNPIADAEIYTYNPPVE